MHILYLADTPISVYFMSDMNLGQNKKQKLTIFLTIDVGTLFAVHILLLSTGCLIISFKKNCVKGERYYGPKPIFKGICRNFQL